jgi:DNA modification methylase
MSNQQSLGLDKKKGSGPVECLGMTFENDEARREHFIELLAEKLKDLEFRKTPGFPKGKDEDILNLSDPPYYTACPNPFLRSFVDHYGKIETTDSDYEREPFSSDVSEGKGTKLYKAHTYHTKVPPHAIARYILHYTQPGDVVLDAFAGCGMTGVAAALCGAPDKDLRGSFQNGEITPAWGSRRAILVDLSPFATFLAHNVTSALPRAVFEEEAHSLLNSVKEQLPPDAYGDPPANYVIWSQVLICPHCTSEFTFVEAAISEQGSITSKFTCPSCKAQLSKGGCDRKTQSFLDPLLQKTISQNEYKPVWVVRDSKKGVLSPLSKKDKASIELASGVLQENIPVVPMMFNGDAWGDMYRAGYHFGVTHAHHFWTQRNLLVLAQLWRSANAMPHPNQMRFVLTSFMVKTGSRMHNVGMKAGRINLAGQIFNTLQIPSIFAERNVFRLAKGKVDDLAAVFDVQKEVDGTIVSTSSASAIDLPDCSMDYIFVDPPFGSNIMYGEMSFLYEAWLRVFTNADPEAIVSSHQKKSLSWYRTEMTRCFEALYRVLKPSRWLTVAFHNSRNDVWNALQEAMRRAGFVIADVRVLDKGQGTFKQMTAAGAVEKDLAISAYRPSEDLSKFVELGGSCAETAWKFIREHLSRTPITVVSAGALEILQERTPQMLFDRMVAFHVERNLEVPLSASEVYAGLEDRFPRRDGMYFLPDQVTEYDLRRTTISELRQLELFVSDEASAVQWVRQQLHQKPQRFQDLQPQLQRIQAWAKHEKTVELKEILKLNFFRYDGSGPVPSQIHSYLSSNFKDMRNLDKEDSRLRAKADDRWYVPDPKKESDLEKLRVRTMLREFEEYRGSKQRKIKQFRTEAVRAGFKAAYDSGDYETIVAVARKIPDKVLQEDDKLLMYYDVATMRLGEDA